MLDANVLRLGTEHDPAAIHKYIPWIIQYGVYPAIVTEVNYKNLIETLRPEVPTLVLFQLSSFRSGASCEHALREFFKLPCCSNRLLLVVADMKVCKPNLLTFVRHVVDSALGELQLQLKEDNNIVIVQRFLSTSAASAAAVENEHTVLNATRILPSVMFLLHIPADLLPMRTCYQTIPLNEWQSIYIDAFSFQNAPLESLENTGIGMESEINDVDDALNDAAFEWLRVAFSIENRVTVESVVDEFKHLSARAFDDSVRATNFRQDPRQNIAGKIIPTRQFYSFIGIEQSKAAYQQNNKNWVCQLFYDRKYLLRAILDAFTEVWSTLLSHSVEDACERISRGKTSNGLVSCVRSSHKWLIMDYMKFLISKEFAANWSLEAFARLPDNIDYDHVCEAIRIWDPTSLISSDSEFAISVFSVLMIHVVVSSHVTTDLSFKLSQFTYNITGKIDCSKADKIVRIPLYHSFINIIKSLLPHAFSKSRISKAVGVSTLMHDEHALRELITTTKPLLNKAMTILESNQVLCEIWEDDFLQITLGFVDHTVIERKLLRKMIRNANFISKFYSDQLNILKSEIEETGNICLWILSTSRLKSYLFNISRILQFTRGIVPEQVLTNLLEIDGSSKPISQSIIDAAIHSLSAILENPNREIMENWISCMRNIVAMEEFRSSVIFSTESVLSRETAVSFATLVIVHNVLGASSAAEPLQTVQFLRNLSEDLCIDDPLSNMLVLLSTAKQQLFLEEQNYFRELVLTCFQWFFQSQEVFQFPSIGFVITNLLHATRPGQLQNQITCDIFNSSIWNEATASELIKVLLLFNRQEVVVYFEDALRSEVLMPQIAVLEDYVYLPSVIAAACGDFVNTHIPTSAELPSGLLMHFHSPTIHNIIFRAIYLTCLAEKDSMSLRRRNEQFVAANVSVDTCVKQIERGVRLFLFLDTVSQIISDSTSTESIAPDIAQPRIAAQIAHAISLSPRECSLYLFSRIKDIATATLVLQNQPFLQRFNLQWWYCPPLADNARIVSNEEAQQRLQMMTRIQVRLAAVHFASYLTTYALREHNFLLPTLTQLIESSVVNEQDEVESEAAKFVKLICAEDTSDVLVMNKHIPHIVAFYKFMKNIFDFRFEDEAEARTLTIEDALNILSPVDRAEGRALYKQFLTSWNELQKGFLTYVICGREVQAASAIPVFTDKHGDRPMTVADVLELPRADEHESCIARILEQRLLKHTKDYLSHPTIAAVRNNPFINKYGYLADFEHKDHGLDRINEYQHESLLLTGLNGDLNVFRQFQMLLAMHNRWVSQEITPPVLPVLQPGDGNNAQLQNFVVAARQARENAAIEAQRNAHNANLIICPKCSMLAERISGCEHLICGSPNRGATAAGRNIGALGCGRAMNANQNRVPLPPPILQAFLPDQAPLPANLINLPPLPPLPPIIGNYHVDWKLLAKFLLARVIQGKVTFTAEDEFFSPVKFHSESTISPAATITLDSPPKSVFKASSLIGPRKNTVSTWQNQVNEYFKASDAVLQRRKLPVRESADVYVRLKITAQHLERRRIRLLGDAVQSILSEEQSTRIEKFIKRQSEKYLETISEQLLALGVALLFILDDVDTYNEESDDENEHFLETQKIKKLNDLRATPILTIFESIPQQSWDHLLRNEIANLSAFSIGEICDIFAELGFEGFGSSEHSFNETIPQHQLKRMTTERDNLIVSALEIDSLENEDQQIINNKIEELKDLGALLQRSVSDAKKATHMTKISSLPFLRPFFERGNRDLTRTLITDLQVRHFGTLIKFIRQALSQFSYMKLTANTIAETLEHNEEIKRSERKEKKSHKNLDLYTEYIPPEWAEYQHNPQLHLPTQEKGVEGNVDDVDEVYFENDFMNETEQDDRRDDVEESVPTTLDTASQQILRNALRKFEDDLQKEGTIEDINKMVIEETLPIPRPQEIILSTNSQTIDSSSFNTYVIPGLAETVSSPTAEDAYINPPVTLHRPGDEERTTVLEPMCAPSSADQQIIRERDFQGAEALLFSQRAINSALDTVLNDLGVEEGLLQYAEEPECLTIAEALPLILQRLFLSKLNLANESWNGQLFPVKDANAAWQLLRKNKDLQEKLQSYGFDLTAEPAASQALLLSYLTEIEIKDLANYFKQLPRRGFLKEMGAL
jgi:hypothetical protein